MSDQHTVRLSGALLIAVAAACWLVTANRIIAVPLTGAGALLPAGRFMAGG